MESHSTDMPQSDQLKCKDEQPVQPRHSSRSRSKSSSRSSRPSIDVARDKRNRSTRSGRHHSKSRSTSRSSSQSRERHDEPLSKRVRRRSRSREHEHRQYPSSRDRPRGRQGSPPPVRVEIKNEPTEPKETLQKSSQRVVKTSGVYIPLPKLRAMQASIKDKSGEEYQRMAWETLKKSIHGLVNKVSKTNLPVIVRQLFGINIIRGRGVFIQSLMKAQSASRTFTNVYAALIAIVNSKLPQLGELLLRRLIVSFRRAYQRNVKSTCIASVEFIAHLVNQRVVHELLALELLMLLLSPSTLTADSVEIAVDFVKQCGQRLTELSPRGVHGVFERLRDILHAESVEARVQYMIEVLFQVRKDGFSDHPAVLEQLDLVPEDEQFTHTLRLNDELSADDQLDVFKLDPNYEENESKFLSMKAEILGEGDADADAEADESGADSDAASEEGDAAEASAGGAKPAAGADAGGVIVDETATNLVSLRRTIYLTIQSALDFEEAAHKLLKMQLKPGQEAEVCYMILDCCAQLRTYEKFFGLLAQRFCALDKKYAEPISNMFAEQYSTCHRLETMKLRNVAKFFAHLLHTDAIPWSVLQCIKLNETDSTSSSRIFIKILFQELAEYIGLVALNQRLQDPTMQTYFAGIFPRDNPKNTRFAINFFTCIGLGGLTDELREFLKSGGAAAKPEPPAVGPTLQPAAALPPVKQEPPESTTRASNLAMKREPSETRISDSETREKKQRLLEHLQQLVDESDSDSPDENQTRDRHKSSKHKEQSRKKADGEHKPSKKASDKREVRAHESKRQKPTEKSHEKASKSAHTEDKEKSGHRSKKQSADAQKEKEKTAKSTRARDSGGSSSRKRSHSPDAPRRFRSDSSASSSSSSRDSASSSGSSSASSSEAEQTPPQKQKQKRNSKSHAEPSRPARHESRPVATASSTHAKKHSRSKSPSPASPKATRHSARTHKR